MPNKGGRRRAAGPERKATPRAKRRKAAAAAAPRTPPRVGAPRPAKVAKGSHPTGKPVLLSGGNPQVAKADGDAPVQAYIAAMPGWKRDVGRTLDRLVEEHVPEVRKAVRWNSPFYGLEGNGWFLTYHCFDRYVKVAFLRGRLLRPLPPVASKHPETRYLHIHENEAIDRELVGSWLRQAASMAGDPLF